MSTRLFFFKFSSAVLDPYMKPVLQEEIVTLPRDRPAQTTCGICTQHDGHLPI